jgi:hypothetical protein
MRSLTYPMESRNERGREVSQPASQQAPAHCTGTVAELITLKTGTAAHPGGLA